MRDLRDVQAPVAKSRIVLTRKPNMVTLPNGDSRIVHREYIADVIANGVGPPTTFDVNAYAINPGQAATFPWLSRIASNYESYKFRQLRFIYSTEASSSLGGSVILAVDYDAKDPAPTDKKTAMSYRSSVRTAPWSACEHSSLAEDLSKSKSSYVRIGAQPAGTDIKTYDVGNLFVASQNITTPGATLGELYVEYDVLLMTPVYESAAALVPVGGTAYGTGDMADFNPFGDGGGHIQPFSNAIIMNNLSALAIDSPGNYLIVVSYTGTVITDAKAVGAELTTAVDEIFQMILASGTEVVAVYSVDVEAAQGIVEFTAVATTITAARLWIAFAPPQSLVA